jgi:hypothetical protein
VSRLAEAALSGNETDCAGQLARFFPKAAAVRVPVQATALTSSSVPLREATVVEYYEPEHAIFVSCLPLEFDDGVKLERDPPGNAKHAVVVAVQYHGGRKAVAVRFTDGPCTWVMEP